MTLMTGTITYLVIWWTTLFCLLPIGARPPESPGRGHMASAPERPHLWKKLAANSILAAVIWLGVLAVIEAGWFDFADQAERLHEQYR